MTTIKNMNKEEALELIESIDCLTPSIEEIPSLEVSDKLMWNWSGEHTIEDIEIDGYFCIAAPVDMELMEFVVKKGEYYYEYNTYKGDDVAFGSKIHVSSTRNFPDKNVVLFLD